MERPTLFTFGPSHHNGAAECALSNPTAGNGQVTHARITKTFSKFLLLFQGRQSCRAPHPARMTRASVTSPFSPKCLRSRSSSTYAGMFLMHSRELGSTMMTVAARRKVC